MILSVDEILKARDIFRQHGINILGKKIDLSEDDKQWLHNQRMIQILNEHLKRVWR